MKELKNRETVIERLVEMLKAFDKEMHNYQTDVYLYIDADGNGTLDEFVNVGGNSWLNDNHYVLYTDKEHTETLADWYSEYSTKTIAEIIGLTEQELIAEAAKKYESEPEEIGIYEIIATIEDNEAYTEAMQENYEAAIDSDFESDYLERAENIVCNFEESED